MIGDGPVDTRDDIAGVAAAGAVEYAHRHHSCVLRDSIGCASNSAGYVGAVTLAVSCVRVVVDEVVTRHQSRAEVVTGVNASVDDVCAHARASAGRRECRAERQGALIDAVETPGRAALRTGRSA